MEARISNEPDISAQLTLWNQSGSKVIRGNLLVVPIGNSVMYFEPVYLQADPKPHPRADPGDRRLRRQGVMEPTLAEALIKIFSGGAVTGSTTTTTRAAPRPLLPQAGPRPRPL